MEDGSKLWVPNTLRCWLVNLKIVEQRYQDFDPVDKLLIRVTAADGSSYIYRTSLNSWTASSFLQNFKYMTRQQLSDQVIITLVPKGRATFVSVQYCDGGSFPVSRYTSLSLAQARWDTTTCSMASVIPMALPRTTKTQP